MSNNPYTHAVGVYGENAKAAITDQRSLEAQILIKSAQQLESLQSEIKVGNKVSLEEIDNVLSYNRKLWTVFAGEMVNDDHDLPQNLKNNISSLSIFVFKRTIDITADTTAEKFDALIEINRNIAKGLRKSLESPAIKKDIKPSVQDTTSQETSITDVQA